MPNMMILLLFDYSKRYRCHCLEFPFEFATLVTFDTLENRVEMLGKTILCTIVKPDFSSTKKHLNIRAILQLVTNQHDSRIYKLIFVIKKVQQPAEVARTFPVLIQSVVHWRINHAGTEDLNKDKTLSSEKIRRWSLFTVPVQCMLWIGDGKPKVIGREEGVWEGIDREKVRNVSFDNGTVHRQVKGTVHHLENGTVQLGEYGRYLDMGLALVIIRPLPLGNLLGYPNLVLLVGQTINENCRYLADPVMTTKDYISHLLLARTQVDQLRFKELAKTYS
jgi:hypothetical protein